MSYGLKGKIVVCVVAIALMSLGNVYGAQTGGKLNSVINGDYAFSIWRSCIETSADGIEPQTLQLKTDGKKVDFIDTGVFRFDGKGNVTTAQTNKIIQMNPDQLGDREFPIVSGLKSVCKGTYSVNSNMSYTSELTCTADLGGGLTLTITPFVSEGQISEDKKVLTTGEIAGTLQTETISAGGMILQTLDRVCITSGSLIKRTKLK